MLIKSRIASVWPACMTGMACLGKLALLAGLAAYRTLFSPLLGQNCRFHPTCSRYASEAVGRYGVLKGLRLSLYRLSKCHPWHPGGVDPVA